VDPPPRLSQWELAAYEVFRECKRQWSRMDAMGGGGLLGIPFERVAIVAAAHRIPVTAAFLRRFSVFVEVAIAADAKRREEEAANEKWKNEHVS
jgi:hypothetical protein